MHLSQTIRKYLGWCPQARTIPRQLPVLNDDIVSNGPAQGSGMPAHTVWLQRYRNQVLLAAVFFTLLSIPLVVYFQTDDFTRLLLYLGTIAGMVVFAFFARWLWNSLQMLEKGMTIKTGPGEYIILFLIAGAIPLSVVLIILVFIGLISVGGGWEFLAFSLGFAFIPWYVFILILLWERRTGCILIYNEKARLFSAVECHEYAQ